MSPPRVRTTTFVSCGRRIYRINVRVVLDFTLFSRLVPLMRPRIRFLFVGSKLCLLEDLSTSAIRLPSDSTSRWTPLPSANGSYYQARSALSAPSCCPCRAHQKKPIRCSSHRIGFHRFRVFRMLSSFNGEPDIQLGRVSAVPAQIALSDRVDGVQG